MTKIDDTELRRRVLEELDWEPSVDASAIGVAAKDGIVTLTGIGRKLCAEEECRARGKTRLRRQGRGRRSGYQVAGGSRTQ